MRTIILNFVLFLNLTAFALPKTEFQFQVMDAETNEALPDVSVRSTFILKYSPWGNFKTERDIRDKSTDKSGLVSFSGRTTNTGGSGTFNHKNYYCQHAGFEFTRQNKILNRWEPWNPTIDVFLRKIKDPVPMAKYNQYVKDIPAYEINLGFDFEYGDWVKPYGKGVKSDMFINMYRRFVDANDHDVVCTITFPNKGDGIQKYEPAEKNKQSSFIFPYVAPQNGYKDLLSLERHCLDGKLTMNFDPDKDLYIFRIRTQLDKKGNVISACYDRFDKRIEPSWGRGIGFSYHFNPDPNSRSLEYNGTNLLKK